MVSWQRQCVVHQNGNLQLQFDSVGYSEQSLAHLCTLLLSLFCFQPKRGKYEDFGLADEWTKLSVPTQPVLLGKVFCPGQRSSAAGTLAQH